MSGSLVKEQKGTYMELLGRMLLLTITEDVSIPIGEFKEMWIEAELPKGFFPKQRSVEDAFRKATPRKRWKNGLALLDYKGGQHIDKGRLETILVYSEDSKKKVDIDHANRAVLYLNGDALYMEPFTPLSSNEMSYIQDIKYSFEDAKSNIDGSQFRCAISKCLNSSYVIPYRDGTYLISPSYFKMADSISKMIQLVNSYGYTNVLWDIPYIDTPDTKAQLLVALKNHINKVHETLVEEASKVKRTLVGHKTYKRSRAQTILNTMKDLLCYVMLYEVLLKQDLGYLKDNINTMAAEVTNILT